MAEAVLFNVATSILNKLGSLALQEVGLLWGLNDELEKLKGTVETIKAVLLDAEKKYHTSNEVKVFVDALKDAVYDAEDLLDDISTETSRQRLKSGNLMTKEVRLCFSWSNRSAYNLTMAHKIKDIRAKLDAIANDRKFHLNLNPAESDIVDYSRDTHSSTPSVVVGRDDNKEEIINLLLGENEERVPFVPIVGFGGIGKTTLAQMVYNDEKVKAHFNLRMWVCVSDIFDIKLVIEKMIGGGKPTGSLDMETLKNQVSDQIRGKRYLLVLDDLWEENREKWLRFNDLIIGGDRRSRTIITTRNKEVAKIVGVMQPYELKGLSDLESWDLFQKMSFKQGEAPNEEFGMIGREIATKCAGIPLAIRTIGSLLYTKETEFEWHSFKDDELTKLDPKINIVETLKLSYNHLPSNLKQCFSYCSLFPKDYKFDVPELIDNWRAQGYVEDNGLSCFRYLLQRSFFQEEEVDTDGDIVSCKMHDFMHDLAVHVSGEESYLQVFSNPNGQAVSPKTRHISFYSDIEEWQVPTHVLQGRKVRTFRVDFTKARAFRVDWTSFRAKRNTMSYAMITELRSLRVLTLTYCNFKRLPSSIQRLKHLRELNLTDNYEIEMLPESVTRLHNLQVLNLNCCMMLKRLPKDIKKLVNLIHLGLFGCLSLEGMPRGIRELTSLEVLSTFQLPMRRCLQPTSIAAGLDELQGLNNLRKELTIDNIEYYLEKGISECKEANLKEKPHLQSLRLFWSSASFDYVGKKISKQEKILEALEPHVNLKRLLLYWYGGVRFPSWLFTLVNLVEIDINGCKHCKSLTGLERLPSLECLEVFGLDEMEYIIENGGAEWNASVVFFPSLKKLSLKRCKKLKGWWSTSTTKLIQDLSSLEKLEILGCDALESFPEWMANITSLNHLSIHECSHLIVPTFISDIPNIKIE